jgi:DNA-binding GntR family transcriptional regulator
MILADRLSPGASLRKEEFGRSHRVSRTPVREALSRPKVEGLASRHPRAGVVDCAPTLDEIIDLYTLRKALEGLAARLSPRSVAPSSTCDDWKCQLLRAGPSPARGADRLMELGQEFHYFIGRVDCNERVQRALR